MIPTLLLFAALVVWRDSTWLVALNLFAIVVALSLGALRTALPFHRAGLTDYAVGLAYAGGAAGGKAVTLMQEDIDWQELPKGSQGRQAVAVGRGLMLAAPLLFLFGALFVAADSVFQDYVSSAVPNPGELMLHVALIVLFGWVSAGLLREYLTSPSPVEGGGSTLVPARGDRADGRPRAARPALPRIRARPAPLSVRRSLGRRGENGLTYAEYARHGFFELVTVAALVLPLLLLFDWLRRREEGALGPALQAPGRGADPAPLRRHGSALQRMRLYQREYGLTELRVYMTGCMLWLAVVFVWTGFTVLRGRRDLFAVGALVSGFAAILAINVAQPRRADRAHEPRPPQPRPPVPDAAERRRDARAREGAADARALAARAAGRGAAPRGVDSQDWRNWNWSRHRAQQALDGLP